MGAAVAILPVTEPNPSIIDVLEDSWNCRCVLSSYQTSKIPVGSGDLPSRQSHRGESSTARSTKDNDHVGLSDATVDTENGSRLRWCHSVDEAELKAIFSTFDENADGMISGKELRRFTNIFGIEMSDADAESMIASVMDTERDGDGGINFHKFCCLYRTHLLGQECSAAEQLESEQEYSANLVEAFKVFDKNGDGFISAEELKDVLLGLGMSAGRSLKQCQKIIQTVDCDGNGQCDISEFKKMMTPRSL